MDLLRKMCCCDGETEDYTGPYERLGEDPAVTIVRSRGNGYSNGGVDEPDSVRGSMSNGPPKTSEEEEEDALNKILEATQHNIIDVTHLDGISINTTDYIQRARQYEEAVMAHDNRVAKTNGSTSKLQSSGRIAHRLLDDSGNRTADWLGRSTITLQLLNEIKEQTARLHGAVCEGIKVTHKTDLVVHMDL